MKNLDHLLGRLVMRSFAVLAFLGAVAAVIFGAIVLVSGHIPGFLALLLGVLLLWLGLRAWRDDASLGDVLNRDFERASSQTDPDQVRGDDS